MKNRLGLLRAKRQPGQRELVGCRRVTHLATNRARERRRRRLGRTDRSIQISALDARKEGF
jgi:hypothetical protein